MDPWAFEVGVLLVAPWHCESMDPPPRQCVESLIIASERVFDTGKQPFSSSPTLNHDLALCSYLWFPKSSLARKDTTLVFLKMCSHSWQRPWATSCMQSSTTAMKNGRASEIVKSSRGTYYKRWSGLIVCFLIKGSFWKLFSLLSGCILYIYTICIHSISASVLPFKADLSSHNIYKGCQPGVYTV